MKRIITGLCAVVLMAVNVGAQSFLKYENVTADDIVMPYTNGEVIIRKGDSIFTAKAGETRIEQGVYAEDLSALKSEGSITVSKDGRLYYSKGGSLYVSKKNGKGKWQKGKKVRVIGLTKDREQHEGSALAYASWRYMPKEEVVIKNPSLSKDGRTLYFATNADSASGMDIWRAQLNGEEEWASPRKLSGGINTKANEDFPFVVDGNTIIFTTDKDGDGKNEVFAQKLSGKEEPVPYTEYFGITKTEKPSVVASDTVAVAEVVPTPEVPKEDIYHKSEKDRLRDFLANDEAVAEQKKVSNNALEDAFAANKDTIIRASKNVVATIDKRILYFDFDTDQQNGNFDEDIEVVKEFINAYPNKSFLVAGHTDERGTYEYNDALSLKRAKKVVDVLASMGVARNRLFAQGFGEYKPVFMNAQTEEQHQKNRRVEIIIMD